MCKKALVASINKAEREKQLTCIKVSRACPPISHMLFLDNSLFFCKARKEKFQTILRNLKEYKVVSDQQRKSLIQFGHKIEEPIRQELRDILGIHNLGGMRSYLGIPENLGGSKIQVFGFINDRLNNRVNGWTFKFFTEGENEVIIKSVVTALPNHVISCFRIPKTVTKKLTSAVAHFLGVQGEIQEVYMGNHGINYVVLRTKEAYGLKSSHILIQLCLESNFGD